MPPTPGLRLRLQRSLPLLLLLLLLAPPARLALIHVDAELDLAAAAAPATPTAPLHPAPAIARLHAELSAQQHPPACATARVLLVRYGAESGVNGFAAMFQFLAGALAVARALNRTLIEAHPLPPQAQQQQQHHPDPWLRAPAAACGGLKLACFLAPLSPCAALGWGGSSASASAPEVAATLAGALAQAPEPVLLLSTLGAHHPLLFAATRGSGPGAPPWWQAAVGQAACVYAGAQAHPTTCARRMYFAALQAYLFQPLPRITQPAAALVQRMRAAAAAAPAPAPGVYALHVRRGDAAVLPWRSSAALEDYVAVAQRGVRGEAGLAQALVGGGGEEEGDAERSARPALPAQRPLLYLATDSAVVRARAAGVAEAAGFELLPPPAATAAALLDGGSGGAEASAHTESVIHRVLLREGLLAVQGEAGAGHGAGGGAVSLLPPLHDYLPPPALIAVSTGNRSAFVAAYVRQAGLTGGDDAAAQAAAQAAFAVMALTDGIVTDIYALSHGTHFVGTCLSQVSRVAYDLAYAAGRARAAPVGLDAAACRAHARHFFPIAADWREGFDVWEDA